MQLATMEHTPTTNAALMDRVEYHADQLGPTNLNVLITGEPGVGKIRIAGRLFRRSSRRFEPLIRIKCGDVRPGFLGNCVDEHTLELNRRLNRPETDVESPFRATLLLQEVGDLEPCSQACLLRLAEERECRRLEGRPLRIDVRLIATSSHDLRKASEQGGFRKDLLYRLKVGHLNIPSLQQRKSEIPRLLTRLLNKYTHHFSDASGIQISAAQWRLLRSYSWPGNDDELEEFVKSLVGLRDAEAAFELLRQKIRLERRVRYPLGSLQSLSRLARHRAERRLIEAVLGQTSGDCRKAAGILDISPALLLSKMQELKIPAPPQT